MTPPLFAYYGDDFTGSTDALEALATHGVSTVLFLGIPEAAVLEQFADYEAVGIAGESRSRTPEWMEKTLPEVFRWLRSLGAPMVQYKVCSTFDSSPAVGNIGVAMRIGRELFASECVPVVVAAPHLRRYVLFGQLFAAEGDGEIYRIDRHPTMRKHPVTPMTESDLRVHLAAQGVGSVGLLDVLALTSGGEKCVCPLFCVFDGLDERTQRATGRLLWDGRERFPFVVGSSGLTYALMSHWGREFQPVKAKAADRVIVMSGSCSPVTDTQIRTAMGKGFVGMSVADFRLEDGLEPLKQGRSLVVYSAPDGQLTGPELGRHLGRLLRELVERSGVRRAVIAGGDTASYATGELGIHALTFEAVLTPGAPLCRAHAKTAAMDGLELVLKGGQVGGSNFFEQVWKGTK